MRFRISFSKILPRVGKRDFGRKLLGSLFSPSLCRGVTDAIFSESGKVLLENIF